MVSHGFFISPFACLFGVVPPASPSGAVFGKKRNLKVL
jgi:hypothetical protein